MRTIKWIVIWIIILGTIAVGLNYVWPNTITFLSYKSPSYDPNSEYAVYNFYNYFNNLSITAQKTSILTLEMPTRQWQSGAWELLGFLDEIVNNLAVILDYGILALNIVMFPFRIIAYIIELLMAAIGFNMSNMEANAFKWLSDLLDWFIARLQIPYV